jgi:hypothetical protein
MAVSKSGSRKAAAKKAAKTRKSSAAARKAAKTRKGRVAAKKAVKTRKRRVAGKKAPATRKARRAVVQPAVSPAVADLDRRIAIVRNNLRDLTEVAAASSGPSAEELTSARIAEQEAELQALIKQRAGLVRRES